MIRIRTLVVFVIIGLSAVVVLENTQAEESFQSEPIVNRHSDSSGL
jgi:hypothetical protein